MKSMMTRSRSLCLPAGTKCMGGKQHLLVAAAAGHGAGGAGGHAPTLPLRGIPHSGATAPTAQRASPLRLRAGQRSGHPRLLLRPLLGRHPQQQQPVSTADLQGAPAASEQGAGNRVPLLREAAADSAVQADQSRRTSPFSDNPYGRAKSDYSCCCASRHHWESTASSLQQPCFSTSLIPDTAAGRQTPPLHGLAAPPSRSPSVKRTWSALTGSLPFLHHSKSAKRIPSNLEALDLVVQATVLAEDSSSVLLDIPASSSSSGCSVGKAVKAITSGWYSPPQIMQNTWKPELRGICERSASSRPQLHNGYSLESCSYRERGPGGGSSEEAGAGNSQLLALMSSSGSDAYSSAITKNGGARGGGSSSSSSPSWPPPRPAAAALLDSCRTSTKKGSRWQRDLRGLAGLGGGFGGVCVPSWR